jgi:transcriptional regulator with XRE-family HTH domain
MVTIKRLREQLGMTQVEYAAKLGVSPSTVHSWDASRSDPTARQLRAIARLSSVPMESIEFEAKHRRDRSKKGDTLDSDV